jgi:polyisoprenoid-binding protein YceI
MTRWKIKWLLLAAAVLSCEGAASGQPHAIDSSKSVMTVRVYKAGVLSALGHDHEIGAPIRSGEVDVAASRVDLRVDAGALRVRDPKTSEKDRSEIQTTMLGAEVLDVQAHPEILFKSTGAEPRGQNSWTVRGDLSLHGQTRPVAVEVTERDGHFVGHALLKQTDFAIKPVRVAGGTVKVKDEIRIEFDIQLAQ